MRLFPSRPYEEEIYNDLNYTILWRCQLKSPQNGDLKNSIIHLSRNIIHMTYRTFIFLKVFTNEDSKCEGQKQY